MLLRAQPELFALVKSRHNIGFGGIDIRLFTPEVDLRLSKRRPLIVSYHEQIVLLVQLLRREPLAKKFDDFLPLILFIYRHIAILA